MGRLDLKSADDHLYCVIDTDKGGGLLVPINGVFYENYKDAHKVYEKALREIYHGDDTYGALLIYRLVLAGPQDPSSPVP